jgi:carboxylesterase
MLSFVKAPIVILQSKKDQVVNPQSANIIYKKVSSKDKQLVWFEKSGHEMLLDLEAEAATNTVMDFINKITGGK